MNKLDEDLINVLKTYVVNKNYPVIELHAPLENSRNYYNNGYKFTIASGDTGVIKHGKHLVVINWDFKSNGVDNFPSDWFLFNKNGLYYVDGRKVEPYNNTWFKVVNPKIEDDVWIISKIHFDKDGDIKAFIETGRVSGDYPDMLRHYDSFSTVKKFSNFSFLHRRRLLDSYFLNRPNDETYSGVDSYLKDGHNVLQTCATKAYAAMDFLDHSYYVIDTESIDPVPIIAQVNVRSVKDSLVKLVTESVSNKLQATYNYYNMNVGIDDTPAVAAPSPWRHH